MSSETRPFKPAEYWWILAAAILYLPLVFQGYGSDNDTYRVLNIGRHLVNTGDYGPSRLPGYPVHEMAVLFLDKFGRALFPNAGSVFTNLGSFLMALLALGSFNSISRSYRLGSSPILLGIMLVFPIFWINAGSTIDFVWAVGFLLAGFAFKLKGRYAVSSICFGLSIGSRLATVIAVTGIILLFITDHTKDWKKTLITGLGAFILGGLCYIPSFIFAKYTFGFLAVATGEPYLWAGYLRTGRFLYKNIYFWGFLPSVYLIILAVVAWCRRRIQWHTEPGLTVACIVIILAYQVLFYMYPIEADYLLTTLPFWMMLLGVWLGDRPRLLTGLWILVLLSNFMSVNIARPDNPNRATGVSFGLWFEKGPLLEDMDIRQRVKNCDHIECYKLWINP